jgi:hypothetical protein
MRPGNDALAGQEEHLRFPDREWTLRWLRRFRGDPFRAAELRRSLAAAGYASIHRCDDDAVLRVLASAIVAGRFQLVRKEFTHLSTGGGVGEESPATPQEEAAAAPPRPRPPQPEEILEEPTFPPDVDTLAIAASQKEAARLGVPFCEECARKAVANALP